MNNDDQKDDFDDQEFLKPLLTAPTLTNSQRMVAGGVAAIYGAGAVFHGALCGSPDVLSEKACEVPFSVPHQMHTESSGNTTQSHRILVMAIGTAISSGTTSDAGPLTWAFGPKST